MAIPLTTVRDHPGFTWGVRLVRMGGLAALAVTIWSVHPRPATHGRGLAVAITLAIGSVAWIWWAARDRGGSGGGSGGDRRQAVPLAVMGVAGGLLGALSPSSPGVAIGAIGILAAGGTLAAEATIAIGVAAALTLAVGALTVDVPSMALFGYLVILAAALAAGFIRLGYRQRAEQAESLLEQIRRATRAEAEAAALGERTRIAREIHDILAHSLGALAMQLEAAHALLGADAVPQTVPEIAKARQCVDRASRLTREGLAESRRAILALREDAGSLVELLERLVRTQNADGSPVSLETRGTPRRLAPDAGLALYRTAQEAVSNARKHAPGVPLVMELVFDAAEVRLTVSNPLAPLAAGPEAADPEAPPALGATGGGFGLTGLRERAELAGGTLTAGPVDDRWRVCATIPG